MQKTVQSFSWDGICRNTCRSRPKYRILLPIYGSKLLESVTSSKKSHSLSYTSSPIDLKEKLRGFWLIDHELSSILIYHNIIELPLFYVEALWRQSRGYNLDDRVFNLESIEDTRRMIVSTEEHRPIKVVVHIPVAQAFRNIHVGKIIPRSPTCENLKVSQRIVVILTLIATIVWVSVWVWA
jgi:hypothetical protein